MKRSSVSPISMTRTAFIRAQHATYSPPTPTKSLSAKRATDLQVQLGALKNRGAIIVGDGDGSRFVLADDVAFAFDAPGNAWDPTSTRGRNLSVPAPRASITYSPGASLKNEKQSLRRENPVAIR